MLREVITSCSTFRAGAASVSIRLVFPLMIPRVNSNTPPSDLIKASECNFFLRNWLRYWFKSWNGISKYSLDGCYASPFIAMKFYDNFTEIWKPAVSRKSPIYFRGIEISLMDYFYRFYAILTLLRMQLMQLVPAFA